MAYNPLASVSHRSRQTELTRNVGGAGVPHLKRLRRSGPPMFFCAREIVRIVGRRERFSVHLGRGRATPPRSPEHNQFGPDYDDWRTSRIASSIAASVPVRSSSTSV